MPQKSIMSCAVATAAAVGGCHLMSAFVTPTTLGTSARAEGVALRGAAASSERPTFGDSVASAAGFGAAAVAVVAVGRASGRTTRRAEPVSAAAAAAAAKAAAVKAAAAGKAATETGAAVAGAAGAGSLSKGSGETVAGEKGTPKPQFDPSTEVGVTQPLGFFDPAGFCKVGDETGFRNLRAAEIKHGRVAMMAALGAVVQHYVKFPGFESVPSGLAAATSPPGSYGFIALFAVAGFLELALWTEDASKEPGNFGDPAGLNMYTLEMRDKELNNGRAAMFAAIGIISAELLTGKDGVEQLGL